MKKFIYLLLFMLSTYLFALPVAHAETDSEIVSLPMVLSQTRPQYPDEAIANGYEGKVVLKIVILENGRVGTVEVAESSGHEILDNEAMKCLKEWAFIPAKLENGKPIEYVALKTIVFLIASKTER